MWKWGIESITVSIHNRRRHFRENFRLRIIGMQWSLFRNIISTVAAIDCCFFCVVSCAYRFPNNVLQLAGGNFGCWFESLEFQETMPIFLKIIAPLRMDWPHRRLPLRNHFLRWLILTVKLIKFFFFKMRWNEKRNDIVKDEKPAGKQTNQIVHHQTAFYLRCRRWAERALYVPLMLQVSRRRDVAQLQPK